MADIKTIALPLPSQEFDSNNEAVTRRLIEQALEEINTKIKAMDIYKSQFLETRSGEAIKSLAKFRGSQN